ncbi:hypothetical protein BC827DRAFT_1372427 [Russula dissimulans]|nr:hypothetical protein BC827DRAFT_1372427 [Russula dissimulans]
MICLAKLFSPLWPVCFFAFAPRGALSMFQFFSYSNVRQCGHFSISFYGGQPPAALPLTLTVVPFNSTPLTFTLPESAWDNSTSSGIYRTVLPLPAGVGFLASLGDAEGNDAALASGVVQIMDSTNTSCISPYNVAPAPFQLVGNAVSRCLPFDVSRNASSSRDHLSARAFIPTGLSSRLPKTGFHTSQGIDTFTYIMNVAQGIPVALLFEDSQGNSQVSDLLWVGGGGSSTDGCLRANSMYTATTQPATQVGGESGSSRAAIIAISVTSPIAVLIIVLLGVFFIQRERRKLIERPNENGEANGPHPVSGPPVPPKPVQLPADVLRSSVPVDPVYPAELFMNRSTGSRRPQSSRSTILAPIPASSLRSAKSLSSITRSVSTRTKYSIHGTHLRPLEDLDIAGLLEVASQQPAATEVPRGYPAASPHTVTPVASPTVPSSSFVSAHNTGNSSISPAHSHPGPDVLLSPLRGLSQEWLNPEQPLRPVLPAAETVAAVRNGLPTKRIKPLPTPTPLQEAGLREPSQNPARF